MMSTEPPAEDQKVTDLERERADAINKRESTRAAFREASAAYRTDPNDTSRGEMKHAADEAASAQARLDTLDEELAHARSTARAARKRDATARLAKIDDERPALVEDDDLREVAMAATLLVPILDRIAARAKVHDRLDVEAFALRKELGISSVNEVINHAHVAAERLARAFTQLGTMLDGAGRALGQDDLGPKLSLRVAGDNSALARARELLGLDPLSAKDNQ